MLAPLDIKTMAQPSLLRRIIMCSGVSPSLLCASISAPFFSKRLTPYKSGKDPLKTFVPIKRHLGIYLRVLCLTILYLNQPPYSNSARGKLQEHERSVEKRGCVKEFSICFSNSLVTSATFITVQFRLPSLFLNIEKRQEIMILLNFGRVFYFIVNVCRAREQTIKPRLTTISLIQPPC